MNRRKLLRNSAIASAGIAGAGLAGCSVEKEPGSGGSSSASELGFNLPKGEGKLNIGYIPWDENIVTSYMWKGALEAAGYEVELHQTSKVGVLFQALADGSYDLFLDTWLPTTHETEWAKHKDVLEDIGVWYDSAKLTMAVPTYVDGVDSLEDLKDNADLFESKIVGIESSSGLAEAVNEHVIPGYGLDAYDHVTSSTNTMLATLDSSINEEKPVLVTLWKPHWAYGTYDLKDLKDPEGALGGAEEIHVVGREGFSADFPDLVDALSTFKMSDEKLSDLEVNALKSDEFKDDPEAGVNAWLEENKFSEFFE
ncbi:glycine betaine ABC transporter substrate-binding protein [Salininema proteolyticum]|uniref:Glycine betaine ABC transporter substrate-binding protein n=1 Tax=Salininema proteolyticum TaxID=1607685 RepID=A0ABV8U0N9_9ACTN